MKNVSNRLESLTANDGHAIISVHSIKFMRSNFTSYTFCVELHVKT